MKKLFYLDTSVWIAYLDKSHQSNSVASKLFEKLVDCAVLISKNIDEEIYGLGYYENYRRIVDKLYKEKCCFGVRQEEIDVVIATRYNEKTRVGYKDCLHIAIGRRKKAILVSFDKDWEVVANNFGFRVYKPEELI